MMVNPATPPTTPPTTAGVAVEVAVDWFVPDPLPAVAVDEASGPVAAVPVGLLGPAQTPLPPTPVLLGNSDVVPDSVKVEDCDRSVVRL
jgi:hypothetical protein